MSHLERLLGEYLEWQGYLVKRNVKVGKLAHGGWEMELDVVGFHPHTHHLIHLEPSTDADTWARGEERFSKKFAAGRKYILPDVFTWLPADTEMEQVAVLVSAGPDRRELGGGKVRTIDEYVAEIRDRIRDRGIVASSAIPEQYLLLRTIQLIVCGYYKVIRLEA